MPGRCVAIAVGIKDIIDTAELLTEMGSPIYKGLAAPAAERHLSWRC